jgi:hypothetical protein
VYSFPDFFVVSSSAFRGAVPRSPGRRVTGDEGLEALGLARSAALLLSLGDSVPRGGAYLPDPHVGVREFRRHASRATIPLENFGVGGEVQQLQRLAGMNGD